MNKIPVSIAKAIRSDENIGSTGLYIDLIPSYYDYKNHTLKMIDVQGMDGGAFEYLNDIFCYENSFSINFVQVKKNEIDNESYLKISDVEKNANLMVAVFDGNKLDIYITLKAEKCNEILLMDIFDINN